MLAAPATASAIEDVLTPRAIALGTGMRAAASGALGPLLNPAGMTLVKQYNIELDYGAGISPKWKDITFSFGFLYYTYPGHDFDDLSYYEVKGGASWTSGAWTLAINNYWSPDFFQAFGQSDAIDGTLTYAFPNWKLWNFFTPSISGQFGFQSFEHDSGGDYTYWNAGLTLAFLNHWSADVRYYDTDYNEDQCLITNGFDRHGCDARAVGTIKVTF